MTLPGSYDLSIYQGDRVEFSLIVKDNTIPLPLPIDLTSYTVAAKIRQTKAGSALAVFTCTVDADQVTNKGKVAVVMLPATSKVLTEGNYLWDLQIKLDATHIWTILAGAVVVIGEVTDDI